MTGTLHCLRELIFGLACTFSQPHQYVVDQPQPFVFGRAVDYSNEEVSQIIWKYEVPAPVSKPVLVASLEPAKPDIQPRPMPTFEQLEKDQPKKPEPIKLPDPSEKKSPTLLDFFRVKKDTGRTTQLAYAGSGLEALSRGLRQRRYDSAPKGSIYALVDGNEDMGCIAKNSRLMSAIRKVHDKYGKTVGIDSAYRSPAYNKGVGGAEKSYHMRCQAVDILVPGVSKDALRVYVRSLPEIGGVGIYNQASIHIDTGPVRNWDWRGRKRTILASAKRHRRR